MVSKEDPVTILYRITKPAQNVAIENRDVDSLNRLLYNKFFFWGWRNMTVSNMEF